MGGGNLEWVIFFVPFVYLSFYVIAYLITRKLFP